MSVKYRMKYYLYALFFSVMFAIIPESVSGTYSVIYAYLSASPDKMVEGVIIKSIAVESVRTNYSYDIVYSYFVNGKEYQNTLVRYDSRTTNAIETTKKYPLGKKVLVYYDVDKPEYSVLEKGNLGIRVYFQIIGVVMMAIILFCVARYLNKKLILI